MVAEFFSGAPIVVRLPAIPQPELSPLGNGYIYFDSGTNKLRASENGGAYVDLIGGGSGAPLATTLALGNTTGGTDIVVSTGDAINGALELTLAAGAASDLTLAARGSLAIPFNQAGEINLDAIYTGAGRSSVIGALNALVDGTISPGTPNLAAVLAVGNTTGANNLSVTTGQKILGAAELSLDGTTVVNLQTGATTRWQVQAAPGHLVPQVDNAIDIGVTATNRIRTLYAGTSVVVGSTVVVTTNAITGSAGLTVSASAGAVAVTTTAGTVTLTAGGAGSDMTFGARGGTVTLNQAGETTLDAIFSGVGRTSLVGALNALVDGTVTPTAPALSAVLAIGNTTGANNILVSSGQRIDAPAALPIGTTTATSLDLSRSGILTSVLGTLNVAEAADFDAVTTFGSGAKLTISAGGDLTKAGAFSITTSVGGITATSAAGLTLTPAAGSTALIGNTSGASAVALAAGPTGSVAMSTGGTSRLTVAAAAVTVGSGVTLTSAAASALTLNGVTSMALQVASTPVVSISATNVNPGADATYDVGAVGSRWKDGYFSGAVIIGSTVTINGTANTIVGSTTLSLSATTGALSLTSAAAADLSLSGRGALTNLNQAGQTALNAIYTGVGRTSLIGAINALVDGTVTPTAPALSAVLAVGNTTGANNISVTTGQKILGAAELTLDGTTVLNLQTAATTRWQVSAAGHLLPGTTDNSEDIGAAATNRIRTLYAGTSVVVGSTVTINGTTNTITSSANMTLDTAAAGTLNLGNTNATTIVVGNGTSAISAAGDVTVTGNLTVNGTTTTVNSTNLTVTDPLIYANNGGLDPSFAGMAWDQGAALDVIMVWNPTDARMEFGRFNTVGGTVLPGGPLTTLINARANNLSLAGTAVTADAALTVTATAATLSLVATGANPIQFTTNGASRWNVASTGHLLANTDNTLDIGATGATRPRRVYVGTEVVVGNTITIGSSTIASSTNLNITSAAGTGGGAGSPLGVSAGAGDGVGAGGGIAITAGQGGATGNGGIATLQGGLGGATSGNGGNATVTGGAPTDGNGGGVTLSGQAGVGTNRNGGAVSVAAGNSTGSGTAGALSLVAGNGGTTAAGGTVTLTAGTGGATNGNGGATSVGAGAASGTGTGGQLTLIGGVSPAGTGGEVVVQTGDTVLASRVRVLSTGLVGVGSGTPLSTLDVQGSFGHQVTSISTSSTADATATVWLVNATGGSVTLTLPSAASAQRRIYHVKKTDASVNTVVIDGAGAETIDGATTQTLIAQYESIQIVSDGTSWFII